MNMNQDTPTDIHETVINTIESDYVKIFWLSPESTAILHRNLTNMTDEELSKEMDLITVFYDTTKHAYQKWFMDLIHYEEDEEKSQMNTPIFNF